VASVDVPDFSKDPIALSGVVLATAEASPSRTLLADELLRSILSDGLTVARRFARSDTLTAFVEAYTDGRTRPDDVRVTAVLTSARGDGVRAETGTRVTSEPGRAGYTVRLPLSVLQAGEYLLTIEARAGGRVATRQVSFAVTAP
jgi:hypothetical protein